MVVGELKAGKSTCLNFLLEDDVLPVDETACTVVVTELHYGEIKKESTFIALPLFHYPPPTLSFSLMHAILSHLFSLLSSHLSPPPPLHSFLPLFQLSNNYTGQDYRFQHQRNV